MSGETSCSAGEQACIDRALAAHKIYFDRHGASLRYCAPDSLGSHVTELGYVVLGLAAAVLVAIVFLVRSRRGRAAETRAT